MATKEQIVDAILKVAGNPAVGEIKDLASDFADAILAIDNPRSKDAKEVRVVVAEETR
jgi:hypothetical protein